MGGFGAPFQALTAGEVAAAATPPSGTSQESIWHQVYDTQTYVSAATTRLTFFQNTNNDKTLSNMESAGQFPAPQAFRLFNICCDIIPATPISTSATVAGSLNDVLLLLLSARATWTLSISNKAYGPYALTLAHATGGGYGNVASVIATPGTAQFGQNSQFPGWNYFGRIMIPQQVSFAVTVDFAAAQTLTGNALIRMSMLGVLNRRVV